MRLKRILILLFAIEVLPCCSWQQDGTYLFLSTGDAGLSFDKQGGIQQLSLSSQRDWEVVEQPDWLVLDLVRGRGSSKPQLISLQVNPNQGKTRSGQVLFSNHSVSTLLSVTQQGAGESEQETDPDHPGGGGDDPADFSHTPELTVAAFIAAAKTDSYYKLTGIVSSFNPETFEMSLSDHSGSISVYQVSNREDWVGRIKNNGLVTLAGRYHYYAGKRKNEVVDAHILAFSLSGGQEEPIAVTVAQFKAASVSEEQLYRLSGRISSIENAVYGNFDLTDDTGTAYIYGLTSTNLGYGANNDKSFASLRLTVGDEIVVVGYRSSYNGQTELRYPYFVEKTGHTDTDDDPPGDLDGDPTFTIDFRTKFSGFPLTNTAGLSEGTYIWSGYPFILKAADKFYQGQVANVYYLLIGKQNSYIQLPVMAGKALMGIKFLTAPQASENVVIDVARTDGTRLMINDGKLKKDTEYAWAIPGETGMAYELLVVSNHNAQFQYISLYYE